MAFPVLAIAPSTIGSCPAVKTMLPVRTAGTYAATGRAATGSDLPSDSSFAFTIDGFIGVPVGLIKAVDPNDPTV